MCNLWSVVLASKRILGAMKVQATTKMLRDLRKCLRFDICNGKRRELVLIFEAQIEILISNVI
jgi:hypothetical protein